MDADIEGIAGTTIRTYMLPSHKEGYTFPVAFSKNGKIILLDKDAPSSSAVRSGDDVELIVKSAMPNFYIGVVVKVFGNIYDKIEVDTKRLSPIPPKKPEFCVQARATLYKYPEKEGLTLNIPMAEAEKLERQAGIKFLAYHLDEVQVTIETLGLKR